MTDKTWKQIIKRWKNYYRDDRIDQHISDIYFDDLKFYDDRIALEAADEVMKKLQTFANKIPQLPSIRPIFDEVKERRIRGKATQVEPLPDVDEGIAYLNRAWFKLCHEYIKIGKDLSKTQADKIASDIIDWYRKRQEVYETIEKPTNDDRLLPENFLWGIDTWNNWIIEIVISELQMGKLYKLVKKYPPANGEAYLPGELNQYPKWEETGQEIETDPSDFVPF